MEIKFLELKLAGMSVADYEAKFIELLRYAFYFVKDKKIIGGDLSKVLNHGFTKR